MAEPASCPICGKEFTDKRGVNGHLRYSKLCREANQANLGQSQIQESQPEPQIEEPTPQQNQEVVNQTFSTRLAETNVPKKPMPVYQPPVQPKEIRLGASARLPAQAVVLLQEFLNMGVGKTTDEVIEKALNALAVYHNLSKNVNQTGGKTMYEEDNTLKMLDEMDKRKLERQMIEAKLKEMGISTRLAPEESPGYSSGAFDKVQRMRDAAMEREMMRRAQMEMAAQLNTQGYGLPGQPGYGQRPNSEIEDLKKEFQKFQDVFIKKAEEDKFERRIQELAQSFNSKLEELNKGGGFAREIMQTTERTRSEIESAKEQRMAKEAELRAELERERAARNADDMKRMQEDFQRRNEELMDRLTPKQDDFSEAIKSKVKSQVLDKLDLEKVMTGKETDKTPNFLDYVAAIGNTEMGKGLGNLISGAGQKLAQAPMQAPMSAPQAPVQHRMVALNELTDSDIAKLPSDQQPQVRQMRDDFLKSQQPAQVPAPSFEEEER
jgi:hypothetical protein